MREKETQHKTEKERDKVTERNKGEDGVKRNREAKKERKIFNLKKKT